MQRRPRPRRQRGERRSRGVAPRADVVQPRRFLVLLQMPRVGARVGERSGVEEGARRARSRREPRGRLRMRRRRRRLRRWRRRRGRRRRRRRVFAHRARLPAAPRARPRRRTQASRWRRRDAGLWCVHGRVQEARHRQRPPRSNTRRDPAGHHHGRRACAAVAQAPQRGVGHVLRADDVRHARRQRHVAEAPVQLQQPREVRRGRGGGAVGVRVNTGKEGRRRRVARAAASLSPLHGSQRHGLLRQLPILVLHVVAVATPNGSRRAKRSRARVANSSCVANGIVRRTRRQGCGHTTTQFSSFLLERRTLTRFGCLHLRLCCFSLRLAFNVNERVCGAAERPADECARRACATPCSLLPSRSLG